MESHGSNLCRTCMANIDDPDSSISLVAHLEDDSAVGDVISELTAVQVQEHTDLPGQICASCLEELKRFIQFIRKVRETDRTLRQRLREEIVEVKEETVEIGEEELYQDIETLDFETEMIDEKYSAAEVNYVEWNEIQPEKSHAATYEVSIVDESLEASSMDNKSELEFIGFEDSAVKDDVSGNMDEEPVVLDQSIDTDNKDPSLKKALDDLDEVERKLFRVIVRTKGDFICCACFQIFKTEAALKAHCECHKSRMSFHKSHSCPVCYRRYTTPRAVETHRKQARASKIYECTRCRVRLIDPKRRRQHAHNHPTRELLNSSVLTPIRLQPNYRRGHICCAQACGLAFPSDELLIAHAHEAHKVNKYGASLPGKKEKPFECKVCFKRFRNRGGLRMHQKRKYKETGQQCSICGLNLPTTATLEAHERKHRDEKPFRCEECFKCFSSPAFVKAHMLVHSNDKPFVCSFCEMAFQRKAALLNHELIHTGALPFPCELCSKAFRVKPRLEQHMRTHTGVRPYPCRYCEKSFADHSNRQRHEMGHTGIKPHKCSYCEKTFITRRLRGEHERTHRKALK
ncbi:zinc finger protein 892-like [Wyeomyia smithii]|uniref:zinc finger protein 892-like n=1 Tax=Wyeomyia smithii TaxID=174621 RepID=UPI00246801E9|nr:zinc finger protein 892-like [Wyeomyia smithii]